MKYVLYIEYKNECSLEIFLYSFSWVRFSKNTNWEAIIDPLPPVQAGFWETMAMLVLGYLVVMLTVLSISAIATSATVEGGGVYCILTLLQ